MNWRCAIRPLGPSIALAGALTLLACGGKEDAPPPEPEWTMVHEGLDSALMSVWGTSADDVWTVGGDAGDGPSVLHWDGSEWSAIATETRGNLWWTFGFDGGPVFMAGSEGTILRYSDGTLARMPTPSTDTVFGIWGASPDDMWAVGGSEGGGDRGFVWRLRDDEWVDAAEGVSDALASKALWKVRGSGPDDVWVVGSAGTALHWDGRELQLDSLGGGESLFTVHEANGHFATVGGFATGLLFENDGAGWQRQDDAVLPGLVGIHLTSEGGGYAVGSFGSVVERRKNGWVQIDGPHTSETLHAVWVDPDGGVWTVGGQVQAHPLVRGLLAYRGSRVPKKE